MIYRIVKQAYCFGTDYEGYEPTHYVEQYIVQVRGLLFWRTVKEFRKIRPAVELLHVLNTEE